MNDFVTGLIRTWVPIGVGGVLAWLTVQGVALDAGTGAAAIIAITGVLQGAYYAAVRVAAVKWPWVELLLGSKKAPSYGVGVGVVDPVDLN